nr:MAG TPA: hypothetical protein [Bacteriophage sp.]
MWVWIRTIHSCSLPSTKSDPVSSAIPLFQIPTELNR